MPRKPSEERTGEVRGLVLYQRTGQIDAIDQYSRQLADALCATGMIARYFPDGLSYQEVRAAHVQWILLQYNPFSYARWGFAPGLVGSVLRLRLARSVRLGVFVHEAWVPMDDWRSTIMGIYQRAQLQSLVALADTVMAATDRLVCEIGPQTIHVPVSSNVAPVAQSKRRARQYLGIGDEIVVALFGTAHPSLDRTFTDAAIRGLACRHGPSRLVVLNLGADAPRPRVADGIKVRSPGVLAERELSIHLRASDFLLLPLRDGVSTRRTTLMAGLAHGLPVVALRSQHSDRILVEHPEALRLVAVDDLDGYVSAALDMSEDETGRRVTGDAARLLYEEAFDWPVVAERLATELSRPIGGARRQRRSRTRGAANG